MDNQSYSDFLSSQGGVWCCNKCIPVCFPCCPAAPACPAAAPVYLATGSTVTTGEWVGLGNSSVLFTPSTVTLPAGLTLTGLVLNIRNNVIPAGGFVTAEIFTSPCGFTAPVSTGIAATITGPSDSTTPNCLVVSTGSFSVAQGALLSVRITTTVPLVQGVAVTVLATNP